MKFVIHIYHTLMLSQFVVVILKVPLVNVWLFIYKKKMSSETVNIVAQQKRQYYQNSVFSSFIRVMGLNKLLTTAYFRISSEDS